MSKIVEHTSPPKTDSPPRLVSFSALGILAGILLVNLPWLYGACERAGDYALLLLQTERARQFAALEGAYSRFHFRHPAPTFFYAYALLSPLFSWASSAQGALYGAQFLLNALFLWGTLRALEKHTQFSRLPLALLAAILWTSFSLGDDFIFDPWGPSSVVFPFLATLAGLAVLASGSLSALFLVISGALFCISNHVSTAPVLFVLAAAAASTAWKNRREATLTFSHSEKRQGLYSLLLLFAIAIPVTLESLTSPEGGNIRALVTFLSSSRLESSRSAYETLDYVMRYLSTPFGDWNSGTSISIGCLVIVSALLASRRQEKVAKHLCWLSVSALVLIFGAALQAPGKLHSYLFLFASAPTAILLSISLAMLTGFIQRRNFALSVLLLAGLGSAATFYQKPKQCGGKYETLVSSLALPQGASVQVVPPSAEDWIPFATLTSLLYRKGYAPCVEPTWSFMFTSDLVCRGAIPSRKVVVGLKRSMGTDLEDPPEESSARAQYSRRRILSGDLAALVTTNAVSHEPPG